MENTSRIVKTPQSLPLTPKDWFDARDMKSNRTLNDLVEEVHIALFSHEDAKIRGRYEDFLWATYDEQAIEGSLSADNIEAARMIREHATAGSPVKREKLATISKSLGVVLRRYHQSRKERRDRIGEEIVTGNGDE